jgi:5-methylcytosine-specific restriction protein B
MPESEKAFVREPRRFADEEARVTLRITKTLNSPLGRERIQRHPALTNLSILRRPQGTNYMVTEAEDRAIESLLGAAVVMPAYDLPRLAEETGYDQETLERWVRAIERKHQAIIYGPPGTGKTYLAERLARHLVAEGDGLVEIVQFHPAYTYEDFVQGIRPKARAGGGLDYPIVPGRFLEFCDHTMSRTGRCVLIIDEINRANLARVFGELMYLLEYRERDVPLAAGSAFRIPENVRIIGTMNTADRSIALVDHALRRRFAFIALEPRFDILEKFHENTQFEISGLVSTLRSLNAEIGDPNYAVGISFFLRPDLPMQIEDIWRMEIEPYLEEFFFDQRERVDRFRWEQVKAKILK